MYKSGHLGISSLLYAPIAAVMILTNPLTNIPHIPFALLGLFVIGYTASLPDIDMQLKNERTVSQKGPLGYIEYGLKMLAIIGIPIGAYAIFVPQPTETLGTSGGILFGIGIVGLIIVMSVATTWRALKPIKHRGITHTVWFALFIGAASMFIGITAATTFAYISGVNISAEPFGSFYSVTSIIAFGLYCGFLGTIGTIFHFVGDMITPTKVAPFYPYSNKKYGREFELFGHRSLAKSKFWNGLFATLGSGAILVVMLIHPDVRPVVVELFLGAVG